MKSLAELKALREQVQGQMGVRNTEGNEIRIVVGMATCGIAAGARPVLNELVEEVSKKKLSNVAVSQTGCIGICQYEPVVEVHETGKEKTTYVKVAPGMVEKIVREHIVNGKPVVEFTIGHILNN